VIVERRRAYRHLRQADAPATAQQQLGKLASRLASSDGFPSLPRLPFSILCCTVLGLL
jgi:hypothetical protein